MPANLSKTALRIWEIIKQRDLILHGDNIVVAVSGGADSVALLSIINELAPLMDLDITVAHLNHNLRGKESCKDSDFVRNLAGSMRIKIFSGSSDVRGIAVEDGISIEMAARKARYSFISKAVNQSNAACAVFAHTADDQVENIILRLGRGTGLRGLTGMRCKSTAMGFSVVRPLLDFYKQELIDYLISRNIEWREDASNTDRQMLRNRVRHDIIPGMEAAINPDFKRTVLRSLEVLREEDRWLEKLSSDVYRLCRQQTDKGVSILVELLNSQPVAAQRRVIQHWLLEHGISKAATDFTTIDRIRKLMIAKKGSGEVPLPDRHKVIRKYTELTLVHKKTGQNNRANNTKYPPQKLQIPGITIFEPADIKITVLVKKGVSIVSAPGAGTLPATATLSMEKLAGRSLFVRTRRNGDRFRPMGLKGSKKLQDIFVDQKAPKEQRDNIPIILCENEIAWIPGYSIADGWTVSDPETSNLQLNVSKCNPVSGPEE